MCNWYIKLIQVINNQLYLYESKDFFILVDSPFDGAD